MILLRGPSGNIQGEGRKFLGHFKRHFLTQISPEMLDERYILITAILTVENIHWVYELHATGTYSHHCWKMHHVLTTSKIISIVKHNFQNSLCSMMNNELKYITIDACKADLRKRKKSWGKGRVGLL